MDDSGNSDVHTTNAVDVRYGSITAVILADEYLQAKFNPAFEALSIKHFGTRPDGSPHNLHRRVLGHPAPQSPFAPLREPAKRAAWDTGALKMFETAQYTVVSACVDKVAWYYDYPTWNGDFYEVLVEAVLERCFYLLKNREGVAEVNIETKNPSKNERIKRAYRDAMLRGFDYIPAQKLRERFSSVEPNILRKEDCRPGAQLADLIAGPALQHIRYLNTGRYEITSKFVTALTRILEAEKFYRERGKGPEGYGRIWRPKLKRKRPQT